MNKNDKGGTPLPVHDNVPDNRGLTGGQSGKSKSADDNNIPHDKIFLELLGGNSYDSLDAVKGLGTTLIHITRYGKDEWGRVKYYEAKSDNKYQNMKPGDYIIGPGTHDDISLLEQVKETTHRTGYLAHDMHLDKSKLDHSPSEFFFATRFGTALVRKSK